MNCLLFSFLKHCIFGITQQFSCQYMTYYIQLESSDFPLSNVIVVKVKLLHILYLFKNILSTPVQLVLFKIVEYSRQCKHRYLIAHIVLLRTDNQESCSATLGPHLYLLAIYTNIPFMSESLQNMLLNHFQLDLIVILCERIKLITYENNFTPLLVYIIQQKLQSLC